MQSLPALGILVFATAVTVQAACTNCADYQAGVPWGNVTSSAIREASGIAASRRNPGVLWTHNDGSRDRIFAVATNGTLLAAYNFNKNVDDIEDVAVGPGPISGISYLYIGDIGGNAGTNTSRAEIMIVRAPEPRVNLALAGGPPTSDMSGVDSFTLLYPDGSYDAEALMFDPTLRDLVVVTKDASSTRVYRANVASVTNDASITLEFVTTLDFTDVSGGSISADGSQIILRREGAALQWSRCDSESLLDAFQRTPQPVPVIGLPIEPNGEGITFASTGSGYFTISEGDLPVLYFFEGRCDAPPRFTLRLQDQTAFIGGDARFDAMVTGYPSATFAWRFKGVLLEGENDSYLTLSAISADDAGAYEVTASNPHGTIVSSATLTVRTKPDLRFTEVMPIAAANSTVTTADWWELTSFEEQPLNLSGWRFNDSGGGLSDPFVFPMGITIAPRESIIFVENITPAEFRAWWGANNLPPSVQIVTYSGSGLGLGQNGDGLRLWNSVTTNAADTVASVDFGPADPGVSFNFDPVTRQFGAKSVLGVNGVHRAAAGNDIGSPGRIVAPPTPPRLEARLAGDSVRIQFDTQIGRRYSLEARQDLVTEPWAETGDVLVATDNVTRYFEKPVSAGSRFFRVRVD
jgi:Immunoglobulin I-set domain/Lamin Tail Domain